MCYGENFHRSAAPSPESNIGKHFHRSAAPSPVSDIGHNYAPAPEPEITNNFAPPPEPVEISSKVQRVPTWIMSTGSIAGDQNSVTDDINNDDEGGLFGSGSEDDHSM